MLPNKPPADFIDRRTELEIIFFPLGDSEKLSLFIIGVFIKHFLQNYVFFNNSSLGTNIGNVICLGSTIQRRVRWGVINTISLVIRVNTERFSRLHTFTTIDRL